MHKITSMDQASQVVMAVTLVLFIGAVFAKGFTHDLLLEAGVFLVSVKLIMMAHKNSLSTKAIKDELDEIKHLILTQKSVQ